MPPPPAAVASPWTPSSWRSKPQAQAVEYPDPAKLASVSQRLSRLPGLVTPVEVQRLSHQLADVAHGRAFLLQCGDCAELFSECTPDLVDAKLKLALLMSLVIIWGARLPVVRVGRIAGQYAKPRSKPTERVVVEQPRSDGRPGVERVEREILSFRGDNVNAFEPDPLLRQPDPERLLLAYFHSAATLNHIRAALSSGIADLHAPRSWSFAHVRSAVLQRAFGRIVERLTDALDFMRVVGVDQRRGSPSHHHHHHQHHHAAQYRRRDASSASREERTRSGRYAEGVIGGGSGGTAGTLESVDYWVSHESLMLEYEEALTRAAPRAPPFSDDSEDEDTEGDEQADGPGASAGLRGSDSTASLASRGDGGGAPHYALSAHTLWLGDRTRQLDGAHVEYLRGIANPIGIKVGPSMRPQELLDLLSILDPHATPGRCTLICRFGATRVVECLPPLVRAVQSSAWNGSVIWCCDPMHGNTRASPLDANLKTRSFHDVVNELVESLRLHRQLASQLGGVHLECTGEVDEQGMSVTECTGGSMRLDERELSKRYRTHCDPRLNYEQSLDVAFLLSHSLRPPSRRRRQRQRRLRGARSGATKLEGGGEDGAGGSASVATTTTLAPASSVTSGLGTSDTVPSHPPLPLSHDDGGDDDEDDDEATLLAELVRGITTRP